MPTFWWRSLYSFGFHPFWNFIVSPLFTHVWVAAFGWNTTRMSCYADACPVMMTSWHGNAFKLRLRQDASHFCRRHFQIHFLEWKLLYLDSNFTEVCSQGSIWQYASVGSDNGFAPIWRQAIIWTNDGQVYWRIYASLGLGELNIVTFLRESVGFCYRYISVTKGQ